MGKGSIDDAAPASRRPTQAFFAILFLGRTGSSYLMSLLNSVPQVVCYPEIFVGLTMAQQAALMQAIARGDPAEAHLSYPIDIEESFPTVRLAGKRRITSLGFKTKLRDVQDRTALSSLFRDQSFRIVILDRHDVVEHAISYFTAAQMYRKFHRWNATSGAHVIDAVDIPLHEFRQMVSDIELATRQLVNYVDSLSCDTMHLYYEDLLQDRNKFVRELLSFIGAGEYEIEDIDGMLKTKYIKNKSAPNCERIGNYRELQAAFCGTSIQHLF